MITRSQTAAMQRQTVTRNGIINVGNSCYMNVILQMILSITPVSCSIQKAAPEPGSLGHYLVNMSRSIYANSNKLALYQNAKRFYDRMILDSNGMFEAGSQADSHDLFLYLLDKLHDNFKQPDASASVSNSKLKCNSIYYKSLAYQVENINRNKFSVLQNEFQGVYASTFVCHNCGHSSIKYELFSSIQLHLKSDENTLVSCLQDFAQPEKIPGFLCEKCNVKGDITKKIVIAVTPPTLVCQFKRFEYTETGVVQKITSVIKYPARVDFDAVIPDLMLHDRDGTSVHNDYSLVGIIHHQGSYFGGHYVIEMKDPVNNKWVLCDDDTCTDTLDKLTDISTLASSAVYLLVYRKNPKPVITLG